MNLIKTNKIIKCDTVLCHQNCTHVLSINSYKGDIFLCDDCLKNVKNLFKKDTLKNARN